MTLEDLDKMLSQICEEFPEKQRELVENCGTKLYEQVIENIERDVKEQTGNLKKGVTKVIGSGGGYAAIRPSKTFAPHTHLLENGHRKPDGVGWVSGKHMYRNALNQLAEELVNDSEETLKKLVGDIFD